MLLSVSKFDVGVVQAGGESLGKVLVLHESEGLSLS